MKHFYLLGILFSLAMGGYAKDWNPKTAYWIYGASFMTSHGDVRVSYVRDTIVGSQNCQLLKKDMIEYSYPDKNYTYSVLGHEVTYYKAGVTYILNNNQFDTLYYFSAKINDRYKVTGSLKGYETDNAYAVVADTGSVIINTTRLKWLAVDYNFKTRYNQYTLRDTIIETIGATKYYFLPWDFINGMVDGNEGGSLNCFHDSTFGVYSCNQSTDCKFDFSLLNPSSYEPFINKNKKWKYVDEMFTTCKSCIGSVYYDVYNVYFKGDTIVDNLKYSKLYNKKEQPYAEEEYLAYLMCEDTVSQKVYVVDIGFNKTALLYDFKLNKGDEINMYITGGIYSKQTVIKVDTITVSNKKLKRIEFDGLIMWIEGIGTVTRGYIQSEGELLCLRENNDLWYLNPRFSNCDSIFTQGWNNINTIYNNEVRMFPNPVVSTSVVRVKSNNNEPLKIEIYSYSGALVKEDYFSGDYPIGRVQLSKGMYVYRVVCNNKVIMMDKIIVVNQ